MRTSSRKDRTRGAMMILLTITVPLVLIPVVGLAIDATMIHIVQIKLQAAVDAAALGSGRLLGTSTNPTEIAGEFFKANFAVGQNGFWGATLPNPSTNPSITVSSGVTKTVTISATANVPTLFMRVVGYSQATVGANGQATRRDSRFVFVLDRSGSMAQTKLPDGNYPITDVKTLAAQRIEAFTPGVDEVGLVVFDGTGVVGYPSSTTYSTTVSASGGPDTSFWNGVAGGSSSPPDAVYQIGKVAAGGGTGMADALSLAYIEIQKAHLRDLAANGSDNKLNAILLFTDGVPSAISLYANDPTNGPWLKSSGCTYATSGATNPIYFWVVNSGNPPYTTIYGGNYQIASLAVSSTYSPLWWMQNPNTSPELAAPQYPAGNENGCSNLSAGNGSGWTGYKFLSQIPSTDKWGNKTTIGDGNGYQDSYFVNGSGQHVASSSIYNGTAFTPSSTSSAYQWGLAMWDSVDNVAKNIRTDANHTNRGESTAMNITVYAIGYAGNGGTDAGLLKRVANDPSNTDSPNALPSAWSTQPEGLFILATDLSTLDQAFNTIGSQLLRLTR